ncbi:hypothetical protein BDZ45DRAFT_277047 [Acephala macrosclerotiorum]|nr:hypothetical protein BDZ45DRAFT_277047 [Acephala macrosclerotiorum]
MNKVKTYFLTPGWDFPVGSIQLGSVISDPSFPHRSLTEDNPVSIDTKVHSSHKYDFSDTIDKSKSNKFGLWAQFLQVFGLGAEASVSFDRGSIDKYAFKHMRTEWFLPSKAFAKACLEATNVADFLEQTEYERPVYIITGLKTVEGASVTTVSNKGRGIRAKIGFDGTPAAVPVTIGPEADHKKKEADTTSFKKSSPVVFAFQLSEMWCKEGSDDVVLKDHTKGALFGVGEQKELDLEAEVVEGVKQLQDGMKVVAVFDEDGDEACICVLPDLDTI